MLISLSTLLRGSTYERLKWTFTLYDLNKDGYITKQEVLNVIVAVHELMGFHASPVVSKLQLKARIRAQSFTYLMADLRQDINK